MSGIQGKVIAITGASSGIGEAAARELARRGAHVVLGARRTDRLERLVAEIKAVLERAIRQGGTTLKDFTRADGRPGYFVQELQVYGRAGQGCVRCGHPLEALKQGQRTTVHCPVCQR